MSWTPAVGFEVFGALVGSRGPAGYSPGQVALSRLWPRRRDPEGAPHDDHMKHTDLILKGISQSIAPKPSGRGGVHGSDNPPGVVSDPPP